MKVLSETVITFLCLHCNDSLRSLNPLKYIATLREESFLLLFEDLFKDLLKIMWEL